MAEIHSFNHRAMATHFQVRIANEERSYASQAAQTAIDLIDKLEARLSRFRSGSDIAQLASLRPGERMRVSEPTFACLAIAKRMELVTKCAFCATPAALKSQPSLPQWSLLAEELSVRCEGGQLNFDLGAIGKGFALDRVGEMFREWECPSYLLVAGGSSILAGEPPVDLPGWSCGLGEDDSPQRYFLARASLSGSGLAVKGDHILDPRTGLAAQRKNRAWVIADAAAESDALSTACMVMSEPDLDELVAQDRSWLAFLETAAGVRTVGHRPIPERDLSIQRISTS